MTNRLRKASLWEEANISGLSTSVRRITYYKVATQSIVLGLYADLPDV